MDEITLKPATAIAQALRDRKIGSRELLERFVNRIERFNPALNAVVTLDLDRARTAADAADIAAARGEFKGPLHGVPITVKDTFETAGLRTTAGAKILEHHVPAANAVAVQRLIDAGAIIFGKTNTPLFAADVQTYNDVFGVTNNPWDKARTCGGSSGGSAVAVATGTTAFELGSDIGGSIRTPANYCGVYGHKPTFGIIPRRGHIPGPPGTLSDEDIAVVGPLARSADDLDLALSILAGPLPEQAVAWRFALPPPRRNRLADYRIAAWIDDADYPVDAAVRGALEQLLHALERAGVHVDRDARPGFRLRDAFHTYLDLLWSATSVNLPDKVYERLQNMAAAAAHDDIAIATRHARANTMAHRRWLQIHEAREWYRMAWRELFARYDVLLTPVTPIVAPKHDHSRDAMSRTISINDESRWYWEQLVWVGLAGMAYLPVTAAPIGVADGVPVGVQIIGPYLEDQTPIDFAKRLAEVFGGYQTPPGYS